MKNIHNVINDILLEMALDENITSGIIDLQNPNHIELLALNLFDRGATACLVAEAVNKITIRDGQFPDRQAYNSDGWLVTFPSPEYKQAAIKKGTHFTSDPTHGQGGMHLYYKKRGKQKRQAQQDVSQAPAQQEPTQAAPTNSQQEPPTSQAATPEKPQQSAPAADGKTDIPSEKPSDSSLPKSGDTEPAEKLPQKSEDPIGAPSGDKTPSASTAKTPSAPETKTPVSSPAVQPTQSPINTPQVSITQDFAKTKSWVSSPYGVWRDSAGETAAVESLSGEVTPIKSTDREELKIFADKRKQDV